MTKKWTLEVCCHRLLNFPYKMQGKLKKITPPKKKLIEFFI